MKNKGLALIGPMIVISIVGILALVAIPKAMQIRQHADDSSALGAAYIGKIAEEICYQNACDSVGDSGPYTPEDFIPEGVVQYLFAHRLYAAQQAAGLAVVEQ